MSFPMPALCRWCRTPLREGSCPNRQCYVCACGRQTGGFWSTCDQCQAARNRGQDPLLVLVCGGRDWSDYPRLRKRLAEMPKGQRVVQGGCRGADLMAVEACLELGLEYETVGADWEGLGRRAGPARNRKMLDLKPGLVIAFHGDLARSRGTKDCVEEAGRRHIPVEVVTGREAS
jgi:hypothetical protein